MHAGQATKTPWSFGNDTTRIADYARYFGNSRGATILDDGRRVFGPPEGAGNRGRISELLGPVRYAWECTGARAGLLWAVFGSAADRSQRARRSHWKTHSGWQPRRTRRIEFRSALVDQVGFPFGRVGAKRFHRFSFADGTSINQATKDTRFLPGCLRRTGALRDSSPAQRFACFFRQSGLKEP